MIKNRIERLKHGGRYALPSLFTLSNLAFGFFAIILACDKRFTAACWCIVLAMFMDLLDGAVARLVKGESQFGIEIDSLADMVSFGAAPAVIIYFFTLKDYGFYGYPIAFFYVLCSAVRLARFNVISHSGQASKHYFSGLPTPAGAGLIVSFVLLYTMFEVGKNNPLSAVAPVLYGLIPIIMILISLLMVSNIPYRAFKSKAIFRPKTMFGLLFLLSVIVLTIRYPKDAIFLAFWLYVIFGLVLGFINAVAKIIVRAKHLSRKPEK